MAKTLRNILISLFGAFAMLFAGVFFAACGVDYSKIQLVADKTSVELEVGESVDITFTIEGAPSGFSNQLQSNVNTNASIFSVTDPQALGDNQFVVRVTALAGGSGKLNMRTLEANKECEVEVIVTQYSKTLVSTGETMYVSNSTNFVPSANLFTFDPNTTVKDLSYYQLYSKTFVSEEINLQTYKLVDFDQTETKFIFQNGEDVVERFGRKFDSVKLDANGQLVLMQNGQEEPISQSTNMQFLTIYDASIDNERFESILFSCDTLFVLPDLKVDIMGGYYLQGTNQVVHYENNTTVEGFGHLNFDANGNLIDDIKIVPNNSDMLEFLLRVEMIDANENLEIRMELDKGNDAIVDFFDFVDETASEQEKNYKYIKISQNSLKQASTSLGLSIYYVLAQNVNDESVKVSRKFDIAIEIAPSALLLNGEEFAQDLKLYYHHVYPNYGWEDLKIDVVSNFETSPSYEGLYFTFDSDFLDVMHDGLTVVSGEVKKYDLSIPFKVRAIGQQSGEKTITIHLVSDVLPKEGENIVNGEIVTSINCVIVEGARRLTLDDRFINDDQSAKTLYLDLSDGAVDFVQMDGNDIAYSVLSANSEFKSISARFVAGVDVLDFSGNSLQPYVVSDGKFHVNMTALPKRVGVGSYEFILDNGTSTVVTFEVVSSLKAESTYLRLVADENNLIYSSFDRTEGSLFDNVLNVEIKNDSSNGNFTFGKTASFEIVSNAKTIQTPQLESVGGTELSVSILKDLNVFRLTTINNGDTKISIKLEGVVVNDFTATESELIVYVNVSSYSLLDEFYLKNGENYALNNTIYYDYAEKSSVTFTAYANSTNANNFYQYQLSAESLKTIYENAEDDIFSVTSENFEAIFTQPLVHESFDKKFIYFYAVDSNGRTLDRSETRITISRNGQRKEILLQIYDGLMFFFDNAKDRIVYEEKGVYGDTLATYTIEFSNIFSIRGYGEFDLNTFTFHYTLDRSVEIVLESYIKQRDLPKRYFAHIIPVKYQPVESISLLSSMSRIDFSNKMLTQTIGIKLYPTTSTSKDIRVEFVTTNGNPYSSMLSYQIDSSKKESGIYSIVLSCEDFYNNPALRGGEDITAIEKSLTGMLYIYPQEWGTNFPSISPELQPIKLEIQYRNGSKANPYLLETAQDVLDIGLNETTLKSHYELSGVVDMTSVTSGATPIGILNEKVVGFSGSIVGTSSQSSITNLQVGTNNFRASISGVDYVGLFAQVNDGALLENFTVSGKIDLQMENATYASILTVVNAGELVNVGVKLGLSSIVASESRTLYFGALAAINYNKIVQDFTKYDGTNSNESLRDFSGMTPKNLVFAENDNSVLSITAAKGNIFVGGVVGANNGTIEKISPSSSYKLYGYSGYSAYVNIKITGQMDGEHEVYVGGVAGVSSYYNNASFIPATFIQQNNRPVANEVNVTNIVLKNLLVGGEIDTLYVQDVVDYVGGIAGYVSGETIPNEDASKSIEVSVLGNTSRVFLRGNEYVGGIVGFDYYSTNANDKSNVDFGNSNVVEAVDDGRSSVLAAQIIRTGNMTLPVVDENETDANIKAEQTRARNLFVAIGGHSTGKIYWDDTTKYDFSAFSYLSRGEALPYSSNVVSLESGSTSEYYGDLLSVFVRDDGVIIMDSMLFTHKEVSLELDESDFAMTSEDGDMRVYFMFYFHVSSDVSGELGTAAQDEIEDLNHFTPNANLNGGKNLYPFSMRSQDVSINTSSSNVLAVDSYGNLTVKGAGLEKITLSSILNTVVSQTIYIFVVNFFDKDISSSIFYTTPSLDGTNIGGDANQTLTLRGNAYSNVYVVPTYSLENGMTFNNEEFRISQNGVLTYKNVAYNLSKNTQFTIESERQDTENNFTSAQVNQQMIVFHKLANSSPAEGDRDVYTLVPMLQVEIDGKIYYFRLDNSEIDLNLAYRESATSIHTLRNQRAMKTNEYLKESVEIVSTNLQEPLFYSIESRGDVAYYEQRRMPQSDFDEVKFLNDKISFGTYSFTFDEFVSDYLNKSEQNDLFIFEFTTRFDKDHSTIFYDFVCKINTESKRFKNRYEKGQNIFGEYVFTFYTSELGSGPFCTYVLQLDEATLNYVSINNYSNIFDTTNSDSVVVPAQKGLLEIDLDPVEAVFENFYISNNEINLREGAGVAQFEFVYEKVSSTGVEFVSVPTFGRYENDAYTFSYSALMNLLAQLNLDYKGKIYISYVLQSDNIQDNIPVAFDVTVSHGNAGKERYDTQVELHTMIGSYARLAFENKQQFGDYYYLARGLSYGMNLNLYGFNEENVSFKIQENGQEFSSTNGQVQSNYVSLTKVNGRYVLQVRNVDFNLSDNIGCKVTITTQATKTIEGMTVETQDVLQVYLMKYVFDYQYVEGVNEDIVEGMQNGVIADAVGNPFTLKFAIRNFLEYDSSIMEVRQEVDAFVDEITQKVSWNVYENSKVQTLERGKTITSDAGYYQISSFTVTPIRIYSPNQNIYHFSMSGLYRMRNGGYEYCEVETLDTNRIYTEFSFDVHDQSTQDSPIPVRTYDELMDMQDGEWYILLDNIDIPNLDEAAQKKIENFAPISARIAGLDGNGYTVNFAGVYDFSEQTNVGLFGAISENTILKNIRVKLSDTTFRMNVATYNVGVLAATNEGKISNCSVETDDETSIFTVEGSVDAEESYVAGLVAESSGYITNSRSNLNIRASANLSGFVGINNGHIASSYFRGGNLVNSANNQSTSGFVVQNNGDIFASYVSGDDTNNQESMYYIGEADYIRADSDIAGFVFANSGRIFDSYSNIRLNGLSGHMVSGFAFENTGRIERSFSTSVLKNNDDSNYGFVYSNNVNNNNGTLENGIFECFYLSESITVNGEENGVNVNIGQIIVQDKEVTDIKALTRADFANISEYFANFVVVEGRKYNSVWFFNDNKENRENYNGKQFNVGRLELVSANILASSVRNFDHTETIYDPATGASFVKYVYVYDTFGNALGSVFNPILISSAEEFENYISQENTSLNVNDKNYRLISDIDYENYLFNSVLYKTKFAGYLEGNFMEISGQTLLSTEKMISAGLFAEVGSGAVNDETTIMNFTYAPKLVDFSNANIVGALVGKVNSGNILNINIEGDGTVVGNNIVGGAIGLTTGDFRVENLYSQLSAKARNQTIVGQDDFDILAVGYDGYSFAGSVVGVASGSGTMFNCVTDTIVSAIAYKAGLMFGFVDEDVTITKVKIDVQNEMSLSGKYAGFVVGESKGTFVDVTIDGEGQFENFNQLPYDQEAIGGFAGLISGGKIDQIQMNKSIVVSTESSSQGIEFVGGIAGKITRMERISNVAINDVTLIGYEYVGGLAGSIETSGMTYFENIQVAANLQAIGIGQPYAGVGGLAGFVDESASISLTADATTIANEIEELKAWLAEAAENDKAELNAQIKQKEIEFDAAKINNFDICVKAKVYSYGEGGSVDISVGAIVGDNGAISCSIFDTQSSISDISSNVACELIDLSRQNGMATGSIKNATSEDGVGELQIVNDAMFNVLNFQSTRTSFTCNITGSVSKDDNNFALCKFNVTFFGDVKAEE